MQSTWTSRVEEPSHRWSRGHQRSLDRKAREPYVSSGHSPQLAGIRGASGVYSTVEDLFRLNSALHTEQLISKETLAKAFQRFQLSNGKKEPYGYGWIVRSEEDEPTIVWHGGKGGGYLNSFHREIAARNTVIILSNSSIHHLTVDELADVILDILHDRDYQQPRIPISHPVAAAVFCRGCRPGSGALSQASIRIS